MSFSIRGLNTCNNNIASQLRKFSFGESFAAKKKLNLATTASSENWVNYGLNWICWDY